MTDLLLNVVPQTNAPQAGALPALTNVSRPLEVGALFAAGQPAMLIDASVDTALRFGEMLRELQMLPGGEGPDVDPAAQPAPQKAEAQVDVTVEDAVSLQYATTSELVPFASPQMPTAVSVVDVGQVADGRAELTADELAPVPASLSTKDSTGVFVQRSMSLAPNAATQGFSPETSAVMGSFVAAAAPSAKSESKSAMPESVLAQLASQSVTSAAVTAASFVGEPVTTRTVEHPVSPTRQPLEALLGERLHTQIAMRSEHAVVRLDPPSMGTIEIVIRHDAGQLQVHLRASNSEVARQLHMIGETLRQDLVQRQHEQVSVHVSDSSRDGERQRHRPTLPWQEEPGRALSEAGDELRSFAMDVSSE